MTEKEHPHESLTDQTPRPLTVGKGKWRASFGRALRWTHLLLGLILFPWIALFGISGMLFNHAGLGESLKSRRLAAAELRELTGLQAYPAAQAVADLRPALEAQGYRIDSSCRPRYDGYLILQGDGAGERIIFFYDPERGAGFLGQRQTMPVQANALAQVKAELPKLGAEYLVSQGGQLGPRLKLTSQALAADPPMFPELRLRVRDAQQRSLNVVYSPLDGSLRGRPSDEASPLGFKEWMARLHKMHHFRGLLEPQTFWALFQDLTGLALVIWAVSGLYMAWQRKAHRRTFAIAALSSVLLCSGVSLWLKSELGFGVLTRAEGPGK